MSTIIRHLSVLDGLWHGLHGDPLLLSMTLAALRASKE
jgi:hypothetical protein